MAEPKHMAFTEHLKELRSALIRATLVLAMSFVFAYAYSENIYGFLIKPLISTLPTGMRFVTFTTVSEPFFTYIWVAFFGAVAFSSPYLLYEVWGFVAPALYENEKRVFFPLVIASFFLFILGAGFAYFIVFPVAFKYFLSFSGSELRPYLSMGAYLSMAIKFLMAFGVVFQLPLFMLVMAILGVTDGKTMLSWWRYAIVGSFIVAAILTPPDVVSQILMGMPLVTLYFIGVGLAILFGRKK